MRRRAVLTVMTVIAALTALGQPAGAAYVGRNGKIALVRANQIYTISASGTGLRRLTTSGKNYRPKWSPNGRRIAFVHEASASSKDIWFMNADGSGKVQATHIGAVTGATWSPDGKRIAFGGGDACASSSGCSYLETLTTTIPYQLTPVLQGVYDPRSGPQDIQSVIGTPAWSPDGEVITYQSADYPSSPDRYLLSYHIADGSYGAVDLLEETGGSCCGEDIFALPQYSPSGATLTTTYTPVNPATFQAYPSRIGVEFGSAVGTRRHDSDATFSPDGNKIAVVNDASGMANIFIQSPVAGTSRVKLTAGYNPDWQSLH